MADQEGSIISNRTYNLLAILLTKLEGLEAYDEYMGDMDGDSRRILEQIRSDDEKHAELLRAEIEKLVKQNGLR